MKKTTLLLSLLSIAYLANAQTKSVELYDLVKMFAPDSAKVASVNDWKTGATVNSPVKWETASPQKNPIGYIKNGNFKLSFNGKSIANSDISLSGKTLGGYSEIQLGTTSPSENGTPSYLLEKLFGSKKFSAKLIRTEEGANPTYYYELKMPGKKTIWLILFAEHMGGGDDESLTLNIICLFDQKEFERRSKP